MHYLSSSASNRARKFQWLPIAARWVLLLLSLLGLGGYVFSNYKGSLGEAFGGSDRDEGGMWEGV